MGGHLEIVQWLVARNIPHNISDYRQITPYDKAQIYGFPHVKWWLYKQSPSALPSQHTQIRSGASTLSSHTVSGQTALYAALESGQLDTTATLVRHLGANIFLQDAQRRLPITLAPFGETLLEALRRSKTEPTVVSYKQYMNNYTLDAKLRVKDQEQNVPKALIHAHLAHLKQSLRGDIEKAERKLHDNFTKGEAREVNETLTNELHILLKKLEITNLLFASNLNVLGSSV
ncbi:hypothetical protein Pmani_020174 [Petrolisthes manimaculis]|uniref:Uncharacterized protein n=1 Tax=Petrolisthes manimaculis TaxID=1843537 RepID=A0AAE1PI84_9EUCA|nr:hypothetical protein Pmani_020174 [Petrolisthes manimaculis]